MATNKKATNDQVEDPADATEAFEVALQQLRDPLPAGAIKSRPGPRDRNGNQVYLDYIEWHTAADILDDTWPRWSFDTEAPVIIGNAVSIKATIEIDGVRRSGIGTADLTRGEEMGIKKAEHDALKRAAVKFGIARQLYAKYEESHGDHLDQTDYRDQNAPLPSGVSRGMPQNRPQFTGDERQGETGQEPKRFEDSVAKSLGDLVTPKQLGMIRAISRDANIDAAQECTKLMNCSISELSKRAASDLIDHLQNLQRGGGVVPMRRAN